MSLDADTNTVMRWLYTPDFTVNSPDWAFVWKEVRKLLEAGWSKKDAAAFCRCLEDVNPNLPEIVALERMKRLREKYASNQNPIP